MSQSYTLAASANPNISIIGAGAMGLLYAAFLSTTSCNVTVVARRKDAIGAIEKDGIFVEDDGQVNNYTGIRAVNHLEIAPVPDLVIVAVKGPDTAQAMAAYASCIPKNATVLTLQNGLGNIETIARHVSLEQILAGVSYTGATLLGAGKVRVCGHGRTYFGELSGRKTPRLLALAQIFERSGITAGISDNIQGLIWTKVLVNVGINPLAALTQLKNGELAALPEGQALMSVLVAEGAELAERLGIALDEPDPVAHTLRVARTTGDNRASMLQDILNGKKTEIESINGMLVSKGWEIGLDLPLNRAITLLIRLLESSRLN